MSSTYQQIVDDVVNDINDDDAMGQVGDTEVMTYIKRWEQNLSQRIDMQGQVDVNLIKNHSDYSTDQLPERVEEFIHVTRLVNGFVRSIEVVSMPRLLEAYRYDTERFIIWSDYDSPMMLAPWTKDNKKYIRVYPVPYQNTTITIYYRLNVASKDLASKALTDEIFIQPEYEEILKSAVEYHILAKVLKDPKRGMEAYQTYENLLVQHDRHMPETARQLVSYR